MDGRAPSGRPGMGGSTGDGIEVPVEMEYIACRWLPSAASPCAALRGLRLLWFQGFAELVMCLRGRSCVLTERRMRRFCLVESGDSPLPVGPMRDHSGWQDRPRLNRCPAWKGMLPLPQAQSLTGCAVTLRWNESRWMIGFGRVSRDCVSFKSLCVGFAGADFVKRSEVSVVLLTRASASFRLNVPLV